jgi:hypothetical protein
MSEYQIEIRLGGYAKENTRRLIYAAARRFNVGGITKNTPLPAIVLYGPFKTQEQDRIAETVAEVAGRYDMVSYRVRGFTHFEVGRRWLIFNQDMRGIYLDVEPSQKLGELRAELVGRLSQFCVGRPIDDGAERRLHAAVEMGELGGRFDGVLAYFKENEERDLSQRVIRLTVVRDRDLVCEYDFLERRLLMGRDGRSRRTIGKTISRIREANEDAFQPLWSLAQKAVALNRRPRQLTLVEDDPATRLPRMLVSRLRRRTPSRRGRDGRQLTLVEDSPSARVPRIFLGVPFTRQHPARSPRGTQLSLDEGGGQSWMPRLIRSLRNRARQASAVKGSR